MTTHSNTNRLINETSPYLLQHAHNPVDWYPWSEEAFERAKAEDKPVLLSIGYSACHWCHVMERESFENEAIAKLMNENFISIKVDREERPDLDSIYMTAVQLMTGHGGWPMTVFLTPEQIPFYGGTYYPPEDRHGMPGFPRILISLAEAYRARRDEISENAVSLLRELDRLGDVRGRDGDLTVESLEATTKQLTRQFDTTHGGFGSKPKFPPAMSLDFLLRQYQRSGNAAILADVELTLEKMAKGGIYDQLGGGFHRYSVDERWLVPHFEKMLYDNALLSRLYIDGWLVTGKELYRRVALETLDYVRREMTDESSGFYSTQDADSEGEEGKFFVWTPQEVEALLGPEDAPLFCRYFDISSLGNFEGHNILHVDLEPGVVARLFNVTPERLIEVIERGRRILFDEREKRVKPGRDEKMLTAWNALMLRSFAEAARAFGSDEYAAVAGRNAEFLIRVMSYRTEDGALRLLRTHKDGKSRLNGYLEDYAYLADALLSLYEATFDIRWFNDARALVDSMIDSFWDKEHGTFYFTSDDHEALITRTKDVYDNATPSGNSVAAEVLLRLALFTGEAEYRKKAEAVIGAVKELAVRSPNGFGRLLSAMDLAIGPSLEIAIIGEKESSEVKSMLKVINETYQPNKVVALGPARGIELLAHRELVDGKPVAYVCRDFVCDAPVTDPEALRAALRAMSP
jgi:uncharacterized protein YyaL (SSP411 family)